MHVLSSSFCGLLHVLFEGLCLFLVEREQTGRVPEFSKATDHGLRGRAPALFKATDYGLRGRAPEF